MRCSGGSVRRGLLAATRRTFGSAQSRAGSPQLRLRQRTCAYLLHLPSLPHLYHRLVIWLESCHTVLQRGGSVAAAAARGDAERSSGWLGPDHTCHACSSPLRHSSTRVTLSCRRSLRGRLPYTCTEEKPQQGPMPCVRSDHRAPSLFPGSAHPSRGAAHSFALAGVSQSVSCQACCAERCMLRSCPIARPTPPPVMVLIVRVVDALQKGPFRNRPRHPMLKGCVCVWLGCGAAFDSVCGGVSTALPTHPSGGMGHRLPSITFAGGASRVRVRASRSARPNTPPHPDPHRTCSPLSRTAHTQGGWPALPGVATAVAHSSATASTTPTAPAEHGWVPLGGGGSSIDRGWAALPYRGEGHQMRPAACGSSAQKPSRFPPRRYQCSSPCAHLAAGEAPAG